jgi:hypothetical protein
VANAERNEEAGTDRETYCKKMPVETRRRDRERRLVGTRGRGVVETTKWLARLQRRHGKAEAGDVVEGMRNRDAGQREHGHGSVAHITDSRGRRGK